MAPVPTSEEVHKITLPRPQLLATRSFPTSRRRALSQLWEHMYCCQVGAPKLGETETRARGPKGRARPGCEHDSPARDASSRRLGIDRRRSLSTSASTRQLLVWLRAAPCLSTTRQA